MAERAVFAVRVARAEDQVRRGDLVERGRAEQVERETVVWVGDAAQRGDEEPDLLPIVQAPGPREPEGDPAQGQRPQERIGVPVRPDQDRHFAVPPLAVGRPLRDPIRHPVGLAAERVEAEVARKGARAGGRNGHGRVKACPRLGLGDHQHSDPGWPGESR